MQYCIYKSFSYQSYILYCITYETLQKKWKPLQTLALSMQIQLMDNLMDNGLNIDDVDKVLLLNIKFWSSNMVSSLYSVID